MNPAPTAHHHPDRERRIPSGLEAGAAFALGTAAPMHYASPLLAAIATATLCLAGGLLRRWPALPTVARPPAGRAAWLCAIFCLGWLGASLLAAIKRTNMWGKAMTVSDMAMPYELQAANLERRSQERKMRWPGPGNLLPVRSGESSRTFPCFAGHSFPAIRTD